MNVFRTYLYILAIIILMVLFHVVLLVSLSHGATIISDSRGSIVIDGDLVKGDAARLMGALGEIDIHYAMGNMLEVVINTFGGDSDAAQAMVYIIKQWSNHNRVLIKTVIYTQAYSGGAMIFLCGDYRYMAPGASFMIHEVKNACV